MGGIYWRNAGLTTERVLQVDVFGTRFIAWEVLT